MTVTPARLPPFGPHFEVAPGVVIRAATFDALYGLMTEYRARHGLAPGDPKRDVDNYVCGKWPHFCQPERQERNAEPEKSLSRRVAEWAANLIRVMPAGGYDLVDTREAARRAEVCKQCPFQSNWKLKCTPCNASTEALLSTVRRMKKTSVDGVMGCNICGTENGTLVWLPNDIARATEQTRDTLPQNCWRKTL